MNQIDLKGKRAVITGGARVSAGGGTITGIRRTGVSLGSTPLLSSRLPQVIERWQATS
jgi:hypothetical protein